jgi:hypothetical protein
VSPGALQLPLLLLLGCKLLIDCCQALQLFRGLLLLQMLLLLLLLLLPQVLCCQRHMLQ